MVFLLAMRELIFHKSPSLQTLKLELAGRLVVALWTLVIDGSLHTPNVWEILDPIMLQDIT